MNTLINTNSKTMTSQQIADLVGSRHDTVKKSIERMIGRGVISKPPMADGIKSANGVVTQVYVFTGEQGKRDSIIVVAQLSPEFTAALVDRWAELERQAKEPVPQLPTNYIEALEQLIVKEKALIAAQPKINHYDRVVERETLLTATQVGQKIGMSAIRLNRVLGELGVYNQAHKRGKAFRQWFIDEGLGEMKQTDMGYSQPLFTLKGEAWVVERLAVESIA